MAEHLSPGVYVEEYDNSPRAMEGVGTSTAGFVGLAEKGAAGGAPCLVANVAEFGRRYGGSLSGFTHGEYRYLSYAVEQFFQNGGTRCYVSRVIPADARKASGEAGALTVEAANEGSWGNKIRLEVKTALRRKLQLLERKGEKTYIVKAANGFEAGNIVKAGNCYNRISSVFEKEATFEEKFEEDMTDASLVPEKVLFIAELDITVRCGDEMEIYEGMSLDPSSKDYVGTRMQGSELVKITVSPGGGIVSPAEEITGEAEGIIALSGGTDGSMEQVDAGTFIGEDKGPGKRTGIQSFLENHSVSIMAVPGITMPEVAASLIAHCENTASRFAVLDMPREMSGTKELLEYREMFDSTYAAMYHPWVQQFDRSIKKPAYFPPSGAVMGVYARTDVAKGVHKAPANETLSCTGLSVSYTRAEQDILNPAGVNLIRSIPGNGIRIWGARTASSSSSFRYVNVRRLFIYVEESIRANTSWVVFEPNDASLWSRVRLTISGFLNDVWRAGMLAGASPQESYFVDIGPSTMTQDDIRAGRLICNIGIAPSRPAEFVIFRVTQHTAGAE